MFWNSEPKPPCEKLIKELEKCLNDNNDNSICKNIKSQVELLCTKEDEKKEDEKE